MAVPLSARSPFTVDGKDESPVDWTGGSVNRARWVKTFTGDLSGTSEIEFLMGTLDTGAMVYVGVERFDCELNGRKGTFVVQHAATMLGADYEATWKIVPGSGTGELTGISGHGQITPDHDLLLEYEISS
jgi:Protein of unknown function (DUF3224)